MQTIDSHAHLDFDAFRDDLEEVISRAWGAGLSHIVAIGSGRGTGGAADALALAKRQPRIFATVGVHPHDAHLGIRWQGDPQEPVNQELRQRWEAEERKALDCLLKLTMSPKVVAVGEVGLDYHYDHAPRELQRRLFRSFVRLSLSRRLPLVVHTREAESEAIRILRDEGAGSIGGVFHCYGGSPLLAEAAFDLGFFLGLSGVLTFKKADDLRRMVAQLPLERLLVETDCPYLAPEPYRGKRNEPAHVLEVVRVLAGIKGKNPEEVARVTADNARRLFGIDPSGFNAS